MQTTNPSGGSVWMRQRYHGYGSRAFTSASSVRQPNYQWVGGWGYRRTGRWRSDFYLRARNYSVEESRFTTQVAILQSLLGESTYGYANGSPVFYIDPSGWDPCPPAIEKARGILTVQLMRLEWEPPKVKRVEACIQAVASYGRIQCGHFTQERAKCLMNNFPLVKCIYDGTGPCAGSPPPYGDSPQMPTSYAESQQRSYRTLYLCLGSADDSRPSICDRTGTNYLPQLERNQQQAFWETMLHEALHNCAFDHGIDLRAPRHAPTPERNCNEIAACCIHRVVSDKPTAVCRTSYQIGRASISMNRG